jgi:hypothetical protein
MSSDGCKGDTVPLEMGPWYDFHEVGCHLGNVGFMDGMGGIGGIRRIREASAGVKILAISAGHDQMNQGVP